LKDSLKNAKLVESTIKSVQAKFSKLEAKNSKMVSPKAIKTSATSTKRIEKMK
jgi:hypothetical protein